MISPEIIKLLEKKEEEERFHDLNLGKDFTDMTPKAQISRAQIDKRHYINLKNLQHLKETNSGVRANM